MAFRPKRRFIRTVVSLASGREVIRKSWTYGHTTRALWNAHNRIMAEYPDALSAESYWMDPFGTMRIQEERRAS